MAEPLKLYVGNINFEATEQDLVDFLGSHGCVVSEASILRDRNTDKPRGFGFISVTSGIENALRISEDTENAFMGRPLVIRTYTPKKAA